MRLPLCFSEFSEKGDRIIAFSLYLFFLICAFQEFYQWGEKKKITKFLFLELVQYSGIPLRFPTFTLDLHLLSWNSNQKATAK